MGFYFFFPRGCGTPSDPNWPIGLFGFHGIIEFCYIDQYDAQTQTYSVNPAVVDKLSIENLQDFRLFYGKGTDGNQYQARGASGWYFQASASTAQVAVNDTTQDERDLQGHNAWENPVDFWAKGPTPPVNGQDIRAFDNIFKGLTTFGGYLYGSRDSDVYPGDPGFPQHISGPGPIRLSYIYGDAGTTQNCDLQFDLVNKCTVKLKGTTPNIPDWSNSGSLIPDSDNVKIKLKVGTDALIPIDGLRAIRIRITGWHAHFADHIVKPFQIYPSATFPAGINWIWRENSSPFYCDGGQCYGEYTQQVTYDNNGTPNFGSAIELTGYHQKFIGDWSLNNGQIDRYGINAVAKVWFRNADHSLPNRPDPHDVILTAANSRLPDEVLFVNAQQRKTVHTPGDPLFNVEPDYAFNPGFVFNFSQPVTDIAYVHIDWYYQDQIVGSQFWGGRQQAYPNVFGIQENFHNTILYVKKDFSDVVCDNMSASLVCVPFGQFYYSPIPNNGLVITAIGSAGVPYTFVPYSYSDTNGIDKVEVDWGDGSALEEVTIGAAVNHTYANASYYKIEQTITYTSLDGRADDSAILHIKVVQ